MKALYRKYRPQRLSEVVGQEQVTKSLSNGLAAKKINHAYLFIGPRGTGKTSVARIFAHEVNGFDYKLEDSYVDIIEIDGASNRGIDNIRELREKANIAPTEGKYKIYIIDEVHMLTKEAFNALLKTLEEPPKHVIFIMATTDAYKVPVTITSRAQTYVFKLADAQVMHDFLKKVAEDEKIKITDEAIDIIVKRGGGSFRDSLSLLDQVSTLSDDEITKELVVSAMGLPEDEKINTLLQAYASGAESEIREALQDLLKSGIKPETLAEELISTIIAEPRAELMPLLEKLPEVKDPFAEARLMVALLMQAQPRLQVNQTTTRATTNTLTAGVTDVAAKKGGSANKTESEAPSRSGDGAKSGSNEVDGGSDIGTSVGGAFSWGGYLARIASLNETIHKQLTKCEHEFDGGTLHIYPRSKIMRNILESKNNKKILVDTASGVKINICEPDEHPKSVTKDPTLSKISDIIGGEVMDADGGYDPF